MPIKVTPNKMTPISFSRETGSPIRLKNALVEHVFCSPKELLKLSVPSVVYAVQNNMAFLALSNLDAAVYQVGCTSFAGGQMNV